MADADVVLEDEDGFDAGGHFVCARSLVRRRWRRREFREKDFYRGAFAQFALDANVTAALPDNSVARGESKAAAVPLIFCGEERLEDVALHFVAHDHAGVGDADPAVVARGNRIVDEEFRFIARVDDDCVGFERVPTAVWYRVARVR